MSAVPNKNRQKDIRSPSARCLPRRTAISESVTYREARWLPRRFGVPGAKALGRVGQTSMPAPRILRESKRSYSSTAASVKLKDRPIPDHSSLPMYLVNSP